MIDYIVIGGGSAGCVLASRLTEDPSIRVALIEAGGVDKSVLIHCPAGVAGLGNTPMNWAFDTVPMAGLQGRRGYQPRGRVLGGSSSVNAMVYIRGHRFDYDNWAAQGNAGWSYDEVLPYFKRAEDNSRGADAFHGSGGPLGVSDLRNPNPFAFHFVEAGVQAGYARTPDFNGERQEGMGVYQATQRNGERCSAAKAYLTPNLGRSNLQAITDAQVQRIVVEQGRAVGVQYLQGGQLQELRAGREVLLSAGALQSPQVLMLSGIGPAAHLQEHGIAPVLDLPGVGQNLQDHPDGLIVVKAPHIKDLFGLSLGMPFRMLRGILEWRRARTGLLTTNYAESGGFIRTDAGEDGPPDIQMIFVIAKIEDHGRKVLWGNGYSCHIDLLRPKSRGSVRLAGSDPARPPLIDPNFLSHPDDMQRMVKGFKAMRRILEQPALARFGGKEDPESAAARTDEQIEQHLRTHADTGYHPVGTCRMGRGALDVVDERLRVRGIAGLRVVDASIMPEIVGGNTNAPTIMIAEKAVDMILKGDA